MSPHRAGARSTGAVVLAAAPGPLLVLAAWCLLALLAGTFLPREWASRWRSRDNALAVHSLDVHTAQCGKPNGRGGRNSERLGCCIRCCCCLGALLHCLMSLLAGAFLPREWTNRWPSRDNALAVHSLDVHCTKRQAKRARGSDIQSALAAVSYCIRCLLPCLLLLSEGNSR